MRKQRLPSEGQGGRGETQEVFVKVLLFLIFFGGGWKCANKAASGAVVVQEEGASPGFGSNVMRVSTIEAD